MLTKLLSSFLAKTVIGWWKAFSRDKQNQAIGTARANKAVQDDTIEELEDHAKIDNESISVDDAISGFRLRKPESGDS